MDAHTCANACATPCANVCTHTCLHICHVCQGSVYVAEISLWKQPTFADTCFATMSFRQQQPNERVAAALLKRGPCSLDKTSQVLAQACSHLEGWSTPERVAAGCSAAQPMFERERERAKATVDMRKAYVQEGIDAMGSKVFNALVKDAATLVAKDYIMQHSDKIAKAAVKKFKKSQEYQMELQAARMEQKKTCEVTKSIVKINRMATKIKGEMKRLSGPHQDQVVLKHGFQELHVQMKKAAEPERRPRWITSTGTSSGRHE